MKEQANQVTVKTHREQKQSKYVKFWIREQTHRVKTQHWSSWTCARAGSDVFEAPQRLYNYAFS